MNHSDRRGTAGAGAAMYLVGTLTAVPAGVAGGLRARAAPRGPAQAEPVTCEAAPIGIARGSA